MPAEKSYTYTEATSAAEARIRDLMENAAAAAPASLGTARSYRDWAYGVYLGWLHLTAECAQQEVDAERLEALMDSAGRA